MADVTHPDRHRHLRSALVLLFGRPCLKRYVLWSLAGALALSIFASVWELVPIHPIRTIRVGSAEPNLHAILADGRTLVTSESSDFPYKGAIQFWDVETGEQRISIAGNWSGIRKMEVSPDSKTFTVLDSDNRLTLWDAATGAEIFGFVAFQEEAGLPGWRETRFSPDGRFLIFEKRLKANEGPYFLVFWEIATQVLRARIEGHLSALTIGSDGKQMAIHRWMTDRPHIRIERWRLDADFPDAGPFQVHEVIANDVAISPKLDRFAAVRRKADPENADPGTWFGTDDIQLLDLATGQEMAKVVYINPDWANNHLRFSPNGRFLTDDFPYRFNAINRRDNRAPPLWDTEAGLKVVGADLDVLHFSGDDCWLLVKSKDEGVLLYDTATFNKHCKVSVVGDDGFAVCMGQVFSPSDWDRYNFTPDSRKVLVTRVSRFDNLNSVTDFLGKYISAFQPRFPSVVRLWDVQTGQEIGTFPDCREVIYSPDGKSLVTAYRDGTIKLWPVPPRKPLLTIVCISLVLWLSVVVGLQLCQRLLNWWFNRKSRAHSAA
jgi:WD40 repeat protein